MKGPAHREEHTSSKGCCQKVVEGTGPSGAPQKDATGEVGLTAAQRTNLLIMVATAEKYPEALLTQDDFNRLRASFREH